MFATDHTRNPFEKASAAEPKVRGRVLVIPPEDWGSLNPHLVAKEFADKGIVLRFYGGEETPPLEDVDLVVTMISSAYRSKLGVIGDATRERKVRNLYANTANVARIIDSQFQD